MDYLQHIDPEEIKVLSEIAHELGFGGAHVAELYGSGHLVRGAASMGLNGGHIFDLTASDENGVAWDQRPGDAG